MLTHATRRRSQQLIRFIIYIINPNLTRAGLLALGPTRSYTINSIRGLTLGRVLTLTHRYNAVRGHPVKVPVTLERKISSGGK